MFNHNPYGGYGWGPYSPVIIPPTSNDPIEVVTRQISSLEALKKALKEEKKDDDPKKKKDRESNPAIINMMFLMLLLSPVTGPIMFKFFQWGTSFAFQH